MPTHPCRKLKISTSDQQILEFIAQYPGTDIVKLQAAIAKPLPKIRKRLLQLKRHGYIRMNKDFERLRLVPDET